MTILEVALHLIEQYGYFGLFTSMALGIIGLPIPDETILTFAGYLVSQNDLQLIPTIISSFFGSISGISISFFLGRTLGIRFLYKRGHFFHITESRLIKTKKWLEGYGSWVFLFGYFIPGIRHLTAIVAGSTKTNYSKFAFFAYSGGFLWSLTFVLLGYSVGKKWMVIIEQVHNHILLIAFIVLILLIIYFIVKTKVSNRKINSNTRSK
ncbi:MAG: DedA family protein [Bacteroidetes bacterium]|nr:DedA family protein [Bacteroidota bacterium]